MKETITTQTAVPNACDESERSKTNYLESELYATTWLEHHHQAEFPIADDRQQYRFEHFLLLIDSAFKNEGHKVEEKLVSMICAFSLQLESYIEKLSIYKEEHPTTELRLESHPISYSVKVFSENLKILQRIGAAIKSDFDSTKSKIKHTKDADGKEFDPG